MNNADKINKCLYELTDIVQDFMRRTDCHYDYETFGEIQSKLDNIKTELILED